MMILSLHDKTVLNVVMTGTQATAPSLHLLLLACITNNKPRKFSWLPLDYYGGYTTENGSNVKCVCWTAYTYCIWRVNTGDRDNGRWVMGIGTAENSTQSSCQGAKWKTQLHK